MSELLAPLRRLNRVRLYRRAARKRQALADAQIADMSEQKISEILGLMRRFSPLDVGVQLVRIGPEGDGGYLVPDDLEGIGALYSPGVSDTTGFDSDIANRGIPCHLADGTVDVPEALGGKMTFEKIMVAGTTRPGFTSMADWVNRRGPSVGDLLLQMDIEGAEYEVISVMDPDLIRRFRIMIFELHDVVGKLLNDRASLSAFLDKLQADHVLCHLHPNNASPPVRLLGQNVPDLIEVTFLRRDRATPAGEARYPHPQDQRNNGIFPEPPADRFWAV
ncbi:FkbM family methyltransferase [Ovoidimarina sediminis]|uniref:FkbM family methyltransferase n=1 Tax=Ovoidimarina sediminis TaxID=3079856 RepID=UPI00290F5398|nr:FkbM family methyltransferase [Rhodophyticola sp. MJ-SS7]MDU8942145.1 hypothetical protein [Rhodophyticola sp. MJ-SS7]